MSIKVQKYIANLGKSAVYTAADVIGQKFEYAKDFSDTNRDVFKSAYEGVKNYKTTFNRVKNVIAHNKIMDAAMVGMDSIVYSITTGDFYAKHREEEIMSKYGGELMSGFDIDDEDFDWEREDVSSGEKTIATTIKKNSKISTAMITEAVTSSAQAQMKASRDNTTLLYVQNERMMSKLGHGIDSISDILKTNAERTEAINKKHIENMSRFMTNVDNNVAKLTAQFDELLEMQRNLYSLNTKQDQSSGKKLSYSDVINSNGVLDIRNYGKMIKKNSMEFLNETIPGFNMVFGDTMGKGSNMLAQFAATPFRSLMTAGINMALGKEFDKSAKQLDNTLKGAIPTILNKLVNARESDNGLAKVLGKVLGVKQQSDEVYNGTNYTKGAIPFDGITKRAITDVIPYYLRQMTSVLTGKPEMMYDYKTAKFIPIHTAISDAQSTLNTGKNQAKRFLHSTIREGFGRDYDKVFKNSYDQKNFEEAVDSLAEKLYKNRGDLTSMKSDDLTYKEEEVFNLLMHMMDLGTLSKNNKGRYVNSRTASGLERSTLIDWVNTFSAMHASHNSTIKSVANGDNNIMREIQSAGYLEKNLKDYKNHQFMGTAMDIYTSSGSVDAKKIFNFPTTQAIIHARDDYGLTIFNYLRDMGSSLRLIDANTSSLYGLTTGRRGRRSGGSGHNSQSFTEARERALRSGIGGAHSGYDRDRVNDIYNTNYLAQRDLTTEAERAQHRANAQVQYNAEHGTFSIDTADFNASGKGTKDIYDANVAKIREKYLRDLENNRGKNRHAQIDKLKGLLSDDRINALHSVQDDYDDSKSLSENLKNAATLDEKLLIVTNALFDKTAGIRDKAADSMARASQFIEEMIFGKALKNGTKRESIVGVLKQGFDKVGEWFKDKFNKGFNWLKKTLWGDDTHIGPLQKARNWLIGTKDAEGNYTGGKLSGAWNAISGAFRRDARAVRDWTTGTVQDEYNRRFKYRASNYDIDNRWKEMYNVGGERDKANRKLQGKQQNVERLEQEMVRLAEQQQQELQNAPEDQRQIIENKYRKRIEKLQAKIDKENADIARIENMLNGDGPIHLAYGMPGVNTGRAFRSIVSAGEYINGRKVSARGVYTIHHGDVVTPNQSASRRASDAIGERNYAATHGDKLMSMNANASDGLSQQEKWERRANVISRAGIGAGIGTLAGGPILGGLIGATSAFYRSTNAFSQAIFGDVIYDENGKPKFDMNGRPLRNDNGLLSKKMQENLPGAKKGALAGGVLGMLTPLGPLGGVFLGSAIGFAKNTDLFKNELFGEGGIIGKEKLDKLKKSTKQMGVGAAAGALFLPGPFGLVGSAIIGSAAGYVTAQDKFKEMIFGKDIDPNDPEKGKSGGLVGALKKGAEPLKNFGKTIIDGTMDALFGKEDKDGKRTGGLFGMIKENVVNPLAKFANEAANRLKVVVNNIGATATRTFNRMRAKNAGGNFLDRLAYRGGRIGHAFVGGLGAIGKVATTPTRLLGKWADRSKLKRIRKGQAYDMNAFERSELRRKGEVPDDNFAQFDKILMNTDAEGIDELIATLSYARDNEYDENEHMGLQGDLLKDTLSNYKMNPKTVQKIVKAAKSDNLREAQNLIGSAKDWSGQPLSNEAKDSCLTQVQMYIDAKRKSADTIEKLRQQGGVTEEVLRERFGMDIDLNNPRQVDSLLRTLKREKVHKQGNITKEEIERNRINVALNPVITGVDKVNKTLRDIYKAITWSNMTKQQRKEYGSYNDFSDKIDEQFADNAASRVANKAQARADDLAANMTMSDVVDAVGEEDAKKFTESRKRAERVFKTLADQSCKDAAGEIAVNANILEGADFKNYISQVFDVPYSFEYRGHTYEGYAKLKYNDANEDGKKWETSYQDDAGREQFVNDWLERVTPKSYKGGNRKSLIKSIMKLSGIGLSSAFSAAAFGDIPLLPVILGAHLTKKYKKQIKSATDLVTGKAKKLVGIGWRWTKNKLGSHEYDEGNKRHNQKIADKILEQFETDYKDEYDRLAEAYNRLPDSEDAAYEQGIFKSRFCNYLYSQSKAFRDLFNEAKEKTWTGRGLIGNILHGTKRIAKGIWHAVTTPLSGAKNKVVGGIENAKQKIRENKDAKWRNKILDKLEKIQNAAEKDKMEGKESRWKKLFKWIFAGGFAAPLVVGFVKKKILPVISEKVAPWIQDKLYGIFIGHDNKRLAENSLAGKIVYPIKDFFAERFQKIRDWFTSSGEYSGEGRGLKGLFHNLTNIGRSIIEYWKVGFKEMYNTLLPQLVESLSYNLVSGVGWVAKGAVRMIGDVISGDYGKAESHLLGTGNGGDVRNESTDTIGNILGKYKWYNTINGTMNVNGSGGTGDGSSSGGGNKGGGWPTLDFSSIIADHPLEQTKKNEDGTVTYGNGAGKEVTTRNLKDNEVYMVGSTPDGKAVYKAVNGSQESLIYDSQSGQYLPIYESEMAQFDGYDNDAMRQLAKAEANGDLNYDYVRSPGAVARATGLIGGQTARQSARILGGVQDDVFKFGTKGFEKVADKFTSSKVLSKIPGAKTLGRGAKFASKVAKVGGAAVNATTKLVTKPIQSAKDIKFYAQYGAYNLGQTKVGKIAKNLKNKVTSAVTKSADTGFLKSLKDLARKGIEKAGDVINTIKDKIMSVLGTTPSPKEAEKLTKSFKDGLKKLVEKVFDKGAKETEEKLVKEGAKGVAKAACASTGIGIIINAAIMVYDFVEGVSDCRNILGIVEEDPSLLERYMGGIINILQDIPYVGILFGILLGIDLIRDWLLTIILEIFSMTIGKVIETLGLDNPFAEIIKHREEATKAIGAFNEANNTDLNLREYNSMMGNDSIGTKIMDTTTGGIFNFFTNSDSKMEDAMDEVDVDTRDSEVLEDLKEDLGDVMSTIWAQYGEDDFNYADSYDANGNKLSSDKKLNANKAKFSNCNAKIMKGIFQMINEENISDDKIIRCNDRLQNLYGWSDVDNLKNLYDYYWHRPEKLLTGMPEEKMYRWKRVRAISGYCGVLWDAFMPLTKRQRFKIVHIVIAAMTDVYFTEEKVKKWGNNKDKFDEGGADREEAYDASTFFGKIRASISKTFMKNGNVVDGMYGNNGVEVQTAANTQTSGKKIDLRSKYKVNNANTATPESDDFVQVGMNGPVPIAMNADADDKLTSINSLFTNNGAQENMIANNMNKAMNTLKSNSFADVYNELVKRNSATNEKIDSLELLPSDEKYWDIQTDKSNPFASAMFRFTELISRTIKAPFAMVASPDSLGSAVVESTKTNTSNSKTATTKSSSMITNIANRLKKISSIGRGKFGRGDDEDHIYQRDYSGSYNVPGDTERQSVADSGCGPAAATALLRMYGNKNASMRQAVNYALHNKYKEVDGGTYPDFFGDYLSNYGIKTNENATNEDVVYSLASGRPVILMGRDVNGGKVPYGSEYSHYVVARGLDRNGNVIVEDSEDRMSNTKYSLADTLRNTTVRITTGQGRFGKAKQQSLGSKFITNVSKATNTALAGIISAANNVSGDKLSASTNTKATTTNTTTTSAAKTNGVAGSIGPDDDVRTSCGYTAEQIKNAMLKVGSCTPTIAEEYSKNGIAVEKKYGINALFTIGVAVHEQGWNENNVTDYNPFNIMGSNSDGGRWSDYDSWSNAFDSFGDLMTTHSVYFKAGNYTPHDIGLHYCPPGGENPDDDYIWPNGVVEIANMIVSRIDGGSGKGKFGRALRRSKFGRATDPYNQTPDPSVAAASANSSSSSSTNKNSGLLGNLTDYAESITKNIFGSTVNDSSKLLGDMTNYGTDVLKHLWGSDIYNSLFGTDSNTSSTSTTAANALSNAAASSDGTYKTWTQSDPRWANKPVGGGGNVANIGCAATSVAIIACHCGAESDKTFDPGKFVDKMNEIGGFGSSGEIYWSMIPQAIPTMQVVEERVHDFDHSSESALAKTLANYIKDGYFIVIDVKNGGHWVAIDRVENGTIYMFDPAQTSERVLFNKYPGSDGNDSLTLFKAVNAGSGRGKGRKMNNGLKSLDEVRASRAKSNARAKAKKQQATANSLSHYGKANYSNNPGGSSLTVGGSSTGINSITTDDPVTRLLQTIANNSDMISEIVGLLDVIRANTTPSKAPTAGDNRYVNGLSGLNSILNQRSNGQDIDAVYTIAKR